MAKTTPAQSAWMENIFGIYLAVVCAISLLIATILLGTLVNTAIDYAYPRSEEYFEPTIYDPGMKEARPMTEVEKAERRESMTRMRRDNEVRGFLKSSVYFILTTLIFLLHWRLFRKRLKGGR